MTGEKDGLSDVDRMKDLEEERLRQRLIALERHSEKLKSRDRLYGIGILIALALAAVAAFTPHLLAMNGDEISFRTVSAETVLLRDGDGVTRGRWAVDESGNSRLAILDRQGRVRLSMSVLSGGSPGMSFSNANGQSRVALALLPDESTSLAFTDAAGIPRTILGLTRGDAAHLVFADADGDVQVSIGLDPSGEASVILPEEALPDTTIGGRN